MYLNRYFMCYLLSKLNFQRDVMKNIILLITFLTFSINFLFAEYNVIPANKNSAHKYDTYSGIVKIKMKSRFYSENQVKKILNSENIQIIEQAQKFENSLRFNKSKVDKYQVKDISKLLQTEEPLLRTFTIEFDGNIHPEDYAEFLMKNYPEIELAEAIYPDKFLAYTPNDAYVSSQEMLYQIKAFEAWEIEKGNPEVIIGISDSGVMQEHEDIKPGLAPNMNEIPDDNIDNDGNGYIDDYIGCDMSMGPKNLSANSTYNSQDDHGQQVAGVAAARTDNGMGIAGVGFNSSLFPIKVSDGQSLLYGYQSIKYAADRGIKVLNLSWGRVKPFSQFDQDIIDYAVARDVAIFAAAGNLDDDITETWYPAAYKGVIGVGQVNNDDTFISGGTVLGISCDIMAPGKGLWSTGNNGFYEQLSNGTSYSAPVVSGVAALVRSRYPELNAMQTLQHIRQSTDDITESNKPTAYENILPGRINALKAVNTDPFSRPGIQAEEFIYSIDGYETDKFNVGDEVELKIAAFNHLGEGNYVKFSLSVAQDYSSNSIEVLDSDVIIENIPQNSAFEISSFRLKVAKRYLQPIIMRLDISDDDGYADFLKFELIPVKSMTDFENGTIAFSMSDDGNFGFKNISSSVTLGRGFEYLDYGNQLYQGSGLIVVADFERAVSFVYEDFATIQPFGTSLEPNKSVMADSFAVVSQKIGVEITQEIEFNELNDNTAKIIINVKNTSGETISDLGVGYFLDWDIGPNPTENTTELFEEVPVFLSKKDKLNNPDFASEQLWGASAAQIAKSTDNNYPIFGAYINSENSADIAQAAGMTWDYFNGMDEDQQIQMLYSGIDMQTDEINDIGMLLGMRFDGDVAPGESKECAICIAAAEEESNLSIYFTECMHGPIQSVSEHNSKLNIYPNPAKDKLNFTLDYAGVDNYVYSILNLKGEVLIEIIGKSSDNSIDLSGLPAGIYFLRIENNSIEFQRKFLKL